MEAEECDSSMGSVRHLDGRQGGGGGRGSFDRQRRWAQIGSGELGGSNPSSLSACHLPACLNFVPKREELKLVKEAKLLLLKRTAAPFKIHPFGCKNIEGKEGAA